MKKIVKRVVIISCIFVLLILVGGFLLLKNTSMPSLGKIEEVHMDEEAIVDPVIEAHITQAFELLQQNGAMSSEVWPNYEVKNHNILVCERDDKTNEVIHAWKLTNQSLEALTNEQISGLELPQIGVYNLITYEDKESIIIGISKERLDELNQIVNTNFVYEVGVHELYHLYYESYFKLFKLAMEQKRNGGRGTEFPKMAEPRVYRKMLYDHLVNAYEHPEKEDEYLGKAKYWNEKWKKEFPKEYYQAKITDIMEGKARYIQSMMCISKDLSKEEKEQMIINMFDHNFEPRVSIDAESYRLGFVVGVIMDRKDSDWKMKFSKKTMTLVDYLLKDVKEIEDTSDEYQEKLVYSRKQMAEINEMIDEKLQMIALAEQDINIPYLKLNDTYLQGSFETSDFLSSGKQRMVVDFGANFENETGKITLKNISVCEEEKLFGTVYVLPLTMEYQLIDDCLLIENEQVSGKIMVKQTKDKDGRIIYSMK